MALGIAANFACGLSANHGSMAGAMAAGNACRNGVIAALMAQEGVTANPNIIEAKNGFYDTLVGAGHYDAERMADGLGNPFYIESPGIGLKKYPSCYHTHRALDGVFQLLGEHRLSDKDIAEVDVGTSERAMRVLAFPDAATPYQAKYSMPYCIAAAVVDHQVTLDTFTSRQDEKSRTSSRRERRFTFPSPMCPSGPAWRTSVRIRSSSVIPVTIRTTDGRSYNARVDIPRGDPALPLTDDELLAKYRDCGRSQLRPDEIERSVGLVLGLEKVADIGMLIAALSSPSRKA